MFNTDYMRTYLKQRRHDAEAFFGDVADFADKFDEEYKEMSMFVDRLCDCAMSRRDITVFGVDYTCMEEANAVRDMLFAECMDMRKIVKALLICGNDDEDSSKCPFYDDEYPNRCGLDDMLKKYGFKSE